MAATHGVYKSVNTKNTIALCVLNIVATGLPPKSTVIVLTTLSFAVNPVIRAVDALQSPNPSGANIGAIGVVALQCGMAWIIAFLVNMILIAAGV